MSVETTEVESGIRGLLAAGRPAPALAALEQARSMLAVDVAVELECRCWCLVGSVRGLREAVGTAGAIASLDDEVALVVAEGAFPEVDLPREGELGGLREDAAAAGRAAELVRVLLALAERAPRVDERVGHLEVAEGLAQVLDDRRLSALVGAFLARADADFGELEDAIERADAVLLEVTAEESPRAVAIALMVRRVVRGAAPVPTPSGTVQEVSVGVRADDAMLGGLLDSLGWGRGYPGATWGLRM